MDLERVTVALRPRRAWEAVDLGFVLARSCWRTAACRASRLPKSASTALNAVAVAARFDAALPTLSGDINAPLEPMPKDAAKTSGSVQVQPVGQAGAGQPPSRARGLALSLAYSLGMALVYTALGVAAGLLGEGLAAYLQKPAVLAAFAVLLVGLGFYRKTLD